MDVRIAPPRRRLPGWAWVLGGVLLANLLVLAWLLLRTPEPKVAAAAAVPAPASPAPGPAMAPTPATAPAAAAAPVYTVPPPALSSQPQGGLPAAPLPLPASEPATIAGPSAAAGNLPAPALDVENLPTYQDLLAAGISLPPLALNLHVYDANPGNRYVLLNAMRLREGDVMPDGIKLERITARGAVLDMRGRRFLLSAGG
jgi:hypothetical protein